jgi:hypothetical protein
VTHRTWWRVADILPLAEHAAATIRGVPTNAQRRLGWPDYPALVWTRDHGGDWLSSNGQPAWHTATGTGYQVRAETWTHTATGGTGNPPLTDPGHGVLPLLAEHLDGRRTLLDLLRFADAHELNWLGVDPEPDSEQDYTRYLVRRRRGDLLPPHASWRPATVTSPTLAGGGYRALVADGYTARGGLLARFPADQVAQMARELDQVHADDDHGEVPWVQPLGDTVLILSRATDADGQTCWLEQDLVHADSDDHYAIGMYQWTWLPA